MAHSSFTDHWSPQARDELVQVAKRAIVYAVNYQRPLGVDVQSFCRELREQGACFITLEKNHALRGCIGSLTPRRPLVEDIADNAYSSCLRDPRFPPVDESELAAMSAEISVLSPLEPIYPASEQELLAILVPQVTGLVLDDGIHRATFLPSVWEQLPDAREFVEHLKRKAGIERHAWPQSMQCFVYTVAKFELPDLT